MDVLILTTQSGDWEGFFIDGKLIEEGHTLGDGDSRYFLLEMAEKYGFKRADVREMDVVEQDDIELANIGSFPENLSHLKGNYGE